MVVLVLLVGACGQINTCAPEATSSPTPLASLTIGGEKFKLTWTAEPEGKGGVVLFPFKEAYDEGESVRLVANPANIFDHWEGDLSGSVNPRVIVVDGHKTITGVFELAKMRPSPTPIVATSPTAAIQSSEGLVAYWPADGDANDDEGGHRAALRGDATFAPGIMGQAFSLPQSGAHVEVLSAMMTLISRPMSQ